MRLVKWEALPEAMQTPQVREYYDILSKKRGSLLCKRLFDIGVSAVMLVILSPVFLVLAGFITLDSPRPGFFPPGRAAPDGKPLPVF